MTEAIEVALIVTTPPTIVAITGLILLFKKIKEVHVSLNSRLSELVKSANAQGRQDERDHQEKIAEIVQLDRTVVS